MPLAVHAFGFGGAPITGSGWPSYYIEDMTGHAQSSQAVLTSMIFEGVFDRLPGLRMVLIESGFAWLPALCWRLDRVWMRMRDELHRCKRRPERDRPRSRCSSPPSRWRSRNRPPQLVECIDWIGWDRLLFATDYPHWDFDQPDRVLPSWVDAEKRRAFFTDNALRVYGREIAVTRHMWWRRSPSSRRARAAAWCWRAGGSRSSMSRALFRPAGPLPAPGRAAVGRRVDRARRGRGARRLQLLPARRNPALPLATVGSSTSPRAEPLRPPPPQDARLPRHRRARPRSFAPRPCPSASRRTMSSSRHEAGRPATWAQEQS